MEILDSSHCFNWVDILWSMILCMVYGLREITCPKMREQILIGNINGYV